MPFPSRVHLTALLVLLLLTAALYFQGLSGPFIFDDGPAITGNSQLNIDGMVFDDWRTASLSSDAGPTHRPIAMASFAANIALAGGVDAFPMKFTNMLIHLACGVLVYLFARMVLQRGVRETRADIVAWAALFAAALWLLAPLHVSSVLYTVQRMAQLATLFMLAGLCLFVYQRERWRRRGANAGELIATSLWLLLCVFLAVFSKENGVLLLWLLAVVEVTLFRGQWAGRDIPALRWLGWAALIAPLLLTVAILVGSPGTLIGGYSSRDFTLEERLLTQSRLLWQYIGWMLLPDINSMGFQHDDIPLSSGWLQPFTTLAAAITWVAAFIVAVLLRRRLPLLLFALQFYLVGHFMESGIWPLEMVYEHRNYLPGVGLYILVAALLAGLVTRIPQLRPRVTAPALLAVVGILLFLRVVSWSDGLRLSNINVANHPQSSRTHYFLAESLLDAYRKGQGNGASREQLTTYLVLARNQFELMYQNNPRDMAALVMLYYMDQHHFPQLQAYNDWLAILEALAFDRPLQASDYLALGTLADCVAEGFCLDTQGRVHTFFEGLEHRFPANVRLLALQYRYLKSRHSAREERLVLLDRMREISPQETFFYNYLVKENAEAGDIAGLYEVTRLWLAHDPHRRHLSQIRRMFELPPSTVSGPSAAGKAGENTQQQVADSGGQD